MKHLRVFVWGVLSVMAVLLFVAANERSAVDALRMVKLKMESLEGGKDMVRLTDVREKVDAVFDKPLEGMPTAEIDLEAIEKELRNDPFIATVDAFINARQDLIIELEQRKPIARIINQAGEQYYVDILAHKMPLSRNYTPKVVVCQGNFPSINGKSVRDSIYTIDLEKSVALVSHIQSDAFLDALVESVLLDNRYFELYPKIGDFIIKVDKTGDVQKQLDKLKYWMETEFTESDWASLAYIDLKVNNQVIIGRK